MPKKGRKLTTPIINLQTRYRPSPEAWNFHLAPQRFRFLIWGIRSGKSLAGAHEFCRFALGCPGKLHWCVAPTYNHLQVAETETLKILHNWDGMIKKRNRHRHEIELHNGSLMQFKSAEIPDHLRGPDVDGSMWIDEGAYIRQEAWVILRGRGATQEVDTWVTTTPRGRDWLWLEVLEGTMPADQSYGEFANDDRFISHFPTWNFEWVSEREIESLRKTMDMLTFDQEFGAMFVSEAAAVFKNVEECMSWELLPKDSKLQTVMGLDLGKFQDFTAACIMDGDGRTIYCDHWNELQWGVQKPRIKALADKWNSAIMIDSSNVGSVIEEDLRAMGLTVHSVDMNDSRIKTELIQALQIAFEQRLLQIPDYRSTTAPAATRILYDELKTYEYKLTRSGRLSFGAPKSLHDDMVVALALAWRGRKHGYAGGDGNTITVVLGQDDYNETQEEREERMQEEVLDREEAMAAMEPGLRSIRPSAFGSVFGKSRSGLGLSGYDRPFFGR